MAYLTSDQFKQETVLPTERIAALEARDAGWLPRQLESMSRWIDARLAKRYKVPFDEANPPAIVMVWVERLVTVRCMLRAGVDQTDEQFQEIRDEALAAREQIQEAADSDRGLFELPTSGTNSETASTRGGPLVYSEASPYVHTDVQSDAARDEDRFGGGTSG